MRHMISRSVRSIRSAIKNPILLSQATSSLTGAGVTIAFAAWMTPPQYALFALLNLTSVTIAGFARAAIFQPALIHHRKDRAVRTPVSYVVVATFIGSSILVLIGWAQGVDTLPSCIALGATIIGPMVYDWLRHCRLIEANWWPTAHAELLRLALTSLVVLLQVRENPAIMQSLVNSCYLIAAIGMVRRRRSDPRFTGFSAYRREAGLQAADYGLSTLNSIVPMLILGALGNAQLIGGFRLAQTLFGPLNLLFSGMTSSFIAESATRDSHRVDAVVVREGIRLARLLLGSSVGLVAVTLIVLTVLPIDFRGVSHESLLIGMVAVGSLAVTSGWAGVHVTTLRIMGRNDLIARARGLIIGLTWSAYAIGYLAGGVDLSLILGFATAALAYPIAFVIPANRFYGRFPGATE